MAKKKDSTEAKAKEKETEAQDASESTDEAKVETVEDVLQPTGGEAGGLEESKAKEEEAKSEKPKKAAPKKAEDDDDEQQASERDLNADAAPFAGTAVAGSERKTFGQQGQLYTDGLSGHADHNLDRAYGSGA